MRKILTIGMIALCAAVAAMISLKDTHKTKKLEVKLHELSQKWPAQIDKERPLIFVNQTPLFLAQYLHEQRQVTSAYTNQRDVIVRQLVKSEILRQWVTKMISETTTHYGIVARRPEVNETARATEERNRLARKLALHHLDHGSKSQVHSVKSERVAPSSSAISKNAHAHPSHTLLSLNCYFITYPSEARLDRLNTIDQMRFFERSLKQGKTNFSQLGDQLPAYANPLRYKQVKLEGDELPQDLSDLLKKQRDLSAGQILPLIITERGVWFVEVKNVATMLKRGLHRPFNSETAKLRSRLASIVDKEVKAAVLEIPAQYLDPAVNDRFKFEATSTPILFRLLL